MGLDVILILFGAGILAGILSGMFGVGGGIIIVPALYLVYTYSSVSSPYLMHISIATSLFTIIFTSISSTLRHSKHGNVVSSAAVIIGLVSAISVFIFSKIAVLLPGSILKAVFSVIIAAVAVKLLLDKKRPENDSDLKSSASFNKLSCVLIGFLTGAIAAFSGLGGGIFAVPLMHYLLKFNFKRAIGTSTLAILITSAAGVIGYIVNKPADFIFARYTIGLIDVYAAVPIIAASVPFAQLGVWINKRTHHYVLTKLFALFILAVSLKMLFF
ncbi:MAG TPA: sulfite exporter TauE/SafE family protein [Ignavibacteria bacterium]